MKITPISSNINNHNNKRTLTCRQSFVSKKFIAPSSPKGSMFTKILTKIKELFKPKISKPVKESVFVKSLIAVINNHKRGNPYPKEALRQLLNELPIIETFGMVHGHMLLDKLPDLQDMDNDLIQSIFKQIPEELDYKSRYLYSMNRLDCSQKRYDGSKELDKTKFDLYNKFYKLSGNKAIYSAFCDVVKICLPYKRSDTDKKYVRFASKVIKNNDLGAINLPHLLKSARDIDGEKSSMSIDFINELYASGERKAIPQILKNLATGSVFSKYKIERYKKFYYKYSQIHTAEYLSLIAGLCGFGSMKSLENFAEENIEDEHLPFYLRYCFERSEPLVDYAKQLFKEGVEEDKAKDIIRTLFQEENSIEDGERKFNTLLYIRKEAIKQKDILSPTGEELNDKEIDDVFLNDAYNTVDVFKLLGEKTFFHMFKDKIDNVEDYLDMISIENIQPLMEVINPVNSEKYKGLQNKIKEAKEKLHTTDNKDKVIKEINSLSHEKNLMLKDSIKDPQEAIDLALVYSSLYDAPYVENIKPYMAQRTLEEKQEYYKVLNDAIFETVRIETPPTKVLEKLNFLDNKYLSKIFAADEYFKDNFKDLVEILESEPDKSNLEIFNLLEQNLETREQFEELGIDYDKWVEFNPASFVQVKIKTDMEKSRQSCIRNLEADFNDDLFKKLPQNVQKNIFKPLKEKGIYARKVQEAIYEGDGFFSGTRETIRLYKNDKPIEFDDMKLIIKTIKEHMDKEDFWKTKQSDSQINRAQETIKEHILKLRYNEVKNALAKNADREIDLRIQKTDMNKISHAIFLGNHASCCTSVEGSNGWSAPNYIKNKLITSIELKDGDNFVGNTMCYIAKVDGTPALILDNVELKPKYQFNDKIRDALIEYAKLLCKEIGKQDMPIYAGPNRHKVNFDKFKLEEKEMVIIGSTGEDEIYLDFDAGEHQIDGGDCFRVQLYKID